MGKPVRKSVMMLPLHLLSGALLMSVHLLVWSADSSFPSTVTKSEHAILSAGREAHPRWEQLSPEERKDIRARRKQYEALPPAERERIRNIHQRYQQLSPEERRELQEKWRNHRSADNDARGRSPRTRD